MNEMSGEPGLKARPQPPEVSVVCPFFNEGSLIVEAARRMVANLSQQFGSWELILVNDGSSDDGPQLLAAALDELQETRVRVISYPVNYGRGRALKTGIDAARSDVIVTTEADCSWGDDIVRRLFDRLRTDPACDFVIASPRMAGGAYVDVPPARVFLTKWGNRLISAFFRSGLTMHTGMTRAYRRDVIAPLRTVEHGKEFHLEILFKLIALKFRYREIPATLSWTLRKKNQRTERSPVLNASILRTIRSHFLFLFLADPLRLFSNAVALTTLTAAVFFFLAVHSLIVGTTAIFYAMISILLLLFSFLFVGFAVVLSRLRDQSVESWMREYPVWPPMRSRPDEVILQRVRQGD